MKVVVFVVVGGCESYTAPLTSFLSVLNICAVSGGIVKGAILCETDRKANLPVVFCRLLAAQHRSRGKHLSVLGVV